ncbi:MAG TPA: hypothetical protein VFB27_08180 [Opitutaceae bacterium]|nr:hypothetical protein [Opitutaceae bacterium]
MGRSLLAGLVFFAIFVSGGVAGYFFGVGWARRLQQIEQKARQQQQQKQQQAIAVPFNPMLLHRLAEQLDLSEEQRKQLRPIVARYADEMRVLNGERENAMQRMEEEVNKVLTFDQRMKLERLKEEQRTRLMEQQERVRHFLMNRGGRNAPPAPPKPAASPSAPPAAPAKPAPAQPPAANPPTTTSAPTGLPPTETVPVH